MKKALLSLFVIALIAASTTPARAQFRKVNADVTNSFTQKYPMATDIEWKDKLSGFTANFTLDNIAYLASFTNKGIWESTEQRIEEDDLPEVIKDSYRKSKYAEWTIGKIDKIQLPDSVVQYRVEAVKNDIQKRNLYFSSKGRLLRDKLTL